MAIPRFHGAGRLVLGLCLLAAWAGGPQRVSGQAAPRVDPRVFGLDIPPGELSRPGGQVATHDEAGEAAVAKHYVQVGEHAIVLLPDGQLAVRKGSEITPTDRPFVAAAKQEIAARLTTGPLKDFSVKETRRYLYVYNTSEEFAVAASRIMETMFPGVVLHARARRIAVSEPEVPMVVIMFKTEDQYQAFRRMPPGAVAYYHVLTNQVVMYEESKLAGVKPELALRQSISTIAHEGAHQILANIGVQQRLSIWPMWLGEGLAEYFAPTSTDARLTWKGAGQVNDMRMFELEQYLQHQSAAGTGGKMIEHTASAARLTSTGYAAAWALTHFLAKEKREEFNKLVQEMAARGPFEGSTDVVPPGVIPANLALFRERFGDDLAALEAAQVAHLKKLPYNHPFADQPHVVATIVSQAGGRPQKEANLFLSPAAAQKWVQETVAAMAAEQQATADAKLLQFRNRNEAAQYANRWMRER